MIEASTKKNKIEKIVNREKKKAKKKRILQPSASLLGEFMNANMSILIMDRDIYDYDIAMR